MGGADHGARAVRCDRRARVITARCARAVITAGGARADHSASADEGRAGTAGRGGGEGLTVGGLESLSVYPAPELEHWVALTSGSSEKKTRKSDFVKTFSITDMRMDRHGNGHALNLRAIIGASIPSDAQGNGHARSGDNMRIHPK